jgi:hypothetical protein
MVILGSSRRALLAVVISFACATPSEPAKPADPCVAIAGRFRDALKAASGRCEKDADCGCYNPVIAEAGCGGVTDGATVATLRALEGEFHQAKCAWPHQCPAQQCAPRCDHGTCR